MLKFRTIVVDAERRLGDLEDRNEAAGGVLFELRDDPRVTCWYMIIITITYFGRPFAPPRSSSCSRRC
jgi:hypothetical protein